MRIWQTEMILFSFFTEKGVRSVLIFLVHKNFCENASGCIQNRSETQETVYGLGISKLRKHGRVLFR